MENGVFGDGKSFSCSELTELPVITDKIRAELAAGLILLIGDLGSGKTTFTKALLKSLGSPDTGSSPSYSLINEYELAEGRFIHMDLYRLDKVEEVFRLGIEDYLYESTYCLIEWPQLIMDHLDPPFDILRFEVSESGLRKITLQHIS